MQTFLLMTLGFSSRFVTLLLLRYLLIRIYPKYDNGLTNKTCYLVLMLQNKLKRLFSQAKKITLARVTYTSITCH